MKDETADVAIEEFFGLKSKIYSYLVDDNSGHKKSKRCEQKYCCNNNEYKDALLNKRCLRHSMNRIQRKDHKVGSYEINKISLSSFDNKIYV